MLNPVIAYIPSIATGQILASIPSNLFGGTCGGGKMHIGGGRDLALFEAAAKIGWAFHHNFLSYEYIHGALMAASKHNGLIGEIGAPACEAIIDSGLSYAELDPLPKLPPESKRQKAKVIRLDGWRKTHREPPRTAE